MVDDEQVGAQFGGLLEGGETAVHRGRHLDDFVTAFDLKAVERGVGVGTEVEVAVEPAHQVVASHAPSLQGLGTAGW